MLMKYFQLVHLNNRFLGKMKEYIIDLKQICKHLNWHKRSNYLQILMAHTTYSNIKDTSEK